MWCFRRSCRRSFFKLPSLGRYERRCNENVALKQIFKLAEVFCDYSMMGDYSIMVML